jgi:hypothetical protein
VEALFSSSSRKILRWGGLAHHDTLADLPHCVRDHGQAKTPQIASSDLRGNYISQCPKLSDHLQKMYELSEIKAICIDTLY